MKANVILTNDRSTGERVIAENIELTLASKITALLNDDPSSGRYRTVGVVKIVVTKYFIKQSDRSIFLESVDEDKALLICNALNEHKDKTGNFYSIEQID